MSHTEREILSQPDVWRQTLADLDVSSLRAVVDADVTDIIVTGCGSTHYLALTTAALLRSTGRRAWALPASELMAPEQLHLPDPRASLLLAVSRSGTTTETLMAISRFRDLGGRRVAAITCYPDSPMAGAADAVLATPAAVEESVAQTRSFTSMQLVASALTGALLGSDLEQLAELPVAASRLLADSRTAMAELAREASIASFFFLGSGPLFGIASEGMLKLKEMSLTASEAYHALEFRHGPMAMCDPAAAVLGLVSTQRAELELAVLKDVEQLGATVTSIGSNGEIPEAVPYWASPVLYLLPLQLLALERALAKGLDPDHPRHLSAVIHLDAPGAS